jgi:integrase/recombinase XerD
MNITAYTNNKINTLNEVFNSLTPNTKTAYIKAITDFYNFSGLAINTINQTTIKNITDYIDFLKNKYSNATVNLRINALKSFYKKLSVLRITRNIFDDIKAIGIKTNYQTEKAITRVLTKTEIKKLVTYLENNINYYSNKRNLVLIKLLANTGLRISEALNIQLQDIKNDNGTYTVKINGKGHKERTIFISQEIINLINEIRAGQGFIFITGSNRQLTETEFYIQLKRAGKKALNRHITPHIFRHSFATNLIKATGNFKGVSKYLGHSSTKITLDLYDHNCLSQDDIIYNAI